MKQSLLLSALAILLIDCQRMEIPAVQGYNSPVDKTTCFYRVPLYAGSVKIKDLIMWVEKDNLHPSKAQSTGYVRDNLEK